MEEAAYADRVIVLDQGKIVLDGAPEDVLVRTDALDQRGLSKEDRAANLAGTIHTIEDVSDLRILLVDDVITTGASMREATRALLARGAAEVTAGALCRVW
jgi:predicted amidophosphoribosyltransferase